MNRWLRAVGKADSGFASRGRLLLDEEQEERMAEDDCGQMELRAVIGD